MMLCVKLTGRPSAAGITFNSEIKEVVAKKSPPHLSYSIYIGDELVGRASNLGSFSGWSACPMVNITGRMVKGLHTLRACKDYFVDLYYEQHEEGGGVSK